MAAYRRVYDSPHQQADCPEPRSALEPYAWQSSMAFLHMHETTIDLYVLAHYQITALHLNDGQPHWHVSHAPVSVTGMDRCDCIVCQNIQIYSTLESSSYIEFVEQCK